MTARQGYAAACAEGLVETYRDRCPVCGAESPSFPDRDDEAPAIWLTENGWGFHKGTWLCAKCYAKATRPKEKVTRETVKQEAMW